MTGSTSSQDVERQFKALERAERLQAIKVPAIIFVVMMCIFGGVAYLNHQANQHDAALMKAHTERSTQQAPAVPVAASGVAMGSRCPDDVQIPAGGVAAVGVTLCASADPRSQP